MHPPAITRHRRPFLAPVWLSMLALLVSAGVAVKFYRGASTTVVMLVRPVPKEPGAIDDPPLPAEGEQRAQQLVRMLSAADGGGQIDAIYVSDDRRAQQTAAPLAERLHRAPVMFKSAEARATGQRLLHEHAGGTVLVIGSGSTVPEIIRELRGAEPAAPPTADAAVLYILSVPTFGRPQLVRISF
jgi:broad specificity phosphatase PhoE